MSKFVRLHLMSLCALIAEVPDDWDADESWLGKHSFLENQYSLWNLADKDGAEYRLSSVENIPDSGEPPDARWDSHKKTIVHK